MEEHQPEQTKTKVLLWTQILEKFLFVDIGHYGAMQFLFTPSLELAQTANAVRELSRFLSKPEAIHLKAMYRVMNYCLKYPNTGCNMIKTEGERMRHLYVNNYGESIYF